MSATPPRRRRALAALLFGLSLGSSSCGRASDDPPAAPAVPEVPELVEPTSLPAPAPPQTVAKPRLLDKASSEFSNIRIRQRGSKRTMGFVRERGDEFVQTIIDLDSPDRPAHVYAEAMAAPLLAVADPRRLLVIGLGGGTLVRLFHARLPQAHIDAVEIDPEVVRLAEAWFGIVPGPRLRVITADGVRFIADPGDSYDIIWLDAYLDPGRPGTDNAGVPEELRGLGFLQRVRARLRPGGLAAFNIHHLTGYHEHVAAIAAVFPRLYLVRARKSNEWIILALEADTELTPEALKARAAALDATSEWGISFAELAATVEPWRPRTP